MSTEDNQDDRILACAIATNLEAFDQLIDEMQAEFNEGWGGLDISDALPVLNSVHADQMEHVVLAVSGQDEAELSTIYKIIDTSQARGLQTILVTRDVNSTMLHNLLKSGADGFVPYPMPKGALKAALTPAGLATSAVPEQPTAAPEMANPAEVQAGLAPTPEPAAAPVAPEPKVEQPTAAPAPQPTPVATATPETTPPAPAPQAPVAAAPTLVETPAPAANAVVAMPPAVVPQAGPGGKSGLVFPVYPLAGGVGASTFVTNLAWELQNLVEKDGKRVCILDFALQYGAISTYLDVARSDASLEILTTALGADEQAFEQTLRMHNNKLAVFVTPVDAVPLELVGSAEIGAIIDIARSQFDYVIVDMPNALTSWTEVVLDRAKLFFALSELEMRSAQNALRFMRALKADDLPYEKVQFIINRAPKRTDLNGRGRIKRMADSLNVEFRWLLPDGGKHVTAACDQGAPLANVAGRNPLRKEIRKIATNLLELSGNESQAKASA